jgi:hypothetical protein
LFLVCCAGRGGWQEAERAYQLWKARQVAEQQGSGVVVVQGGRGSFEMKKKTRALLDFAVHHLKGDLFPDLMEYMWEGGCPTEGVIRGPRLRHVRRRFPAPEPRVVFEAWARSIADDVARELNWWFPG